MSDIQLPPMSDIQLPMLSNIRLPPNVRHSTADVVKHSAADVVKHSAAAEYQTFNCRRMSGGFTLFHKRPDISAHSDCSKQPHSENVGDEVFPKLRIPKQLGHYGHAFEDC